MPINFPTFQSLLAIAAIASIPLLTGSTAANAAEPQVVIYTTTQIPLSNIPAGAHVVHLDHQQQLEEQLSQGLPPTPHQAALAMQQRMARPEFAHLQEKLLKASEGVAQAWANKIAKLPAVATADHAYVVYGQPNVAIAMQQLQATRSKQ